MIYQRSQLNLVSAALFLCLQIVFVLRADGPGKYNLTATDANGSLPLITITSGKNTNNYIVFSPPDTITFQINPLPALTGTATWTFGSGSPSTGSTNNPGAVTFTGTTTGPIPITITSSRLDSNSLICNTTQTVVTLLPIELDLVNRDDPTQNWTNEQNQGGLVTVYAGTTTGDEVEWKIDGASGLSGSTFTWTATDSNGNTITGPTGVGVDHWQISDTGGNDPASNTSLTWKPDTYTINCNITSGGSSIAIPFTQKVGWRTEDYVVIGQIVTAHQYDNSGPSLAGEPYFRGAIVSDCSIIPTGTGPLLAAAPLPDFLFGFLEFGNWAITPHIVTPQGPFSDWVILSPGISVPDAITEAERYWMMQNALNASIDTPTAPSQIPQSSLSTTKTDGNYRVFHHYQTRFSLTASGQIDTGTIHDINDNAIVGETKLTIAAGAFSSIGWNNDPITLFSATAETNPLNLSGNYKQTSTDGTKHSSYASGRVGYEGQNASWRVFGEDMPWIFSEIICQVASDHTVASNIKTSVDKTWQDAGSVSGTTAFNNLNIYKAVFTPATGQLNYALQTLLPMEGQLKPFLTSVPYGTWPNPPSTPSVQ